MANIAQPLAGLRPLHAKSQPALGDRHQPLRLGIHRADGEGLAGVADPAAIEHANVDADDVALLQLLAGVGDAVANDLVDGNADRGRERWTQHAPALIGHGAVALVFRQGALAADEALSEVIQLGGGDPRDDVWPQLFIRLGYDAPGIAQRGDLFR